MTRGDTDSAVFDTDDHSGAGIADGAPGEQADPATAQPQSVEQFSDEPGAGRALGVPVDQAEAVGVHPLQGDAGLLAEPQVVDCERVVGGNRVHVARAHVQADYNANETARRLYVHANTLAYRLRTIRRLLGGDPARGDLRLTVELTLKLSDLPRLSG